MKRPRFRPAALVLALMPSFLAGGPAEDDLLLRLDGAYLAYSYDYGQLFGSEVKFKFGPWEASARVLKADFPSRTFLASGEVSLRGTGEVVNADEVLFDLEKETGWIFRFGKEVEVAPFPQAAAMDPGQARRAWEAKATVEDLTLSQVRGSLLFFTAKAIDVLPGFEVIGYDVVTYLEGVESVGFRKFKLSLGERQRTDGFALDKVWFNRTQGLFANLSYSLEREKKVNSLTQLRYEEHSLLKSYSGLPRQVDLQTENIWTLGGGRTDIGLGGNYNSSGLWNARLFFDRRFGEKTGHLLFDFAYHRPLGRPEEAWLGLQTTLGSEKWGSFSFSGRAELHNQALGNLMYSVGLARGLRLSLASTYSRVRLGGLGGVSNIWNGDIGLTYDAGPFNAAADYYLNRDLAGEQRLLRPQLRVGLSPFSFYDGLLTAAVQNVFISNDLRTSSVRSRTYSNNTGVTLSARPVYLRPDFSLQASLAVEQFLEKEGRNFTSGGFILRSLAEFSPAVFLEGFYSVQSRRRTKGWLVEGTTSQDLTALLRIRPEERLNGWVTFSYDPKAGEWRPSYADLAVGLVRNWEFQTLFSFDFSRGKIANVDLYLVRHAGRFDLRFIWRSISKQVLIELIPALGPRTSPEEPPRIR